MIGKFLKGRRVKREREKEIVEKFEMYLKI